MPKTVDTFYLFSHVYLPKLIFANPYLYIFEKGPDTADNFFQHVWNISRMGTAKTLLPNMPDKLVFKMRIFTDKTSQSIVQILEMPETKNPTDAKYIAIVMEMGSPKVRYFTYEYDKNAFNGKGEFYFCEWQIDGTHLDYGKFPDANLDFFREKLKEILSDQPPSNSKTSK